MKNDLAPTILFVFGLAAGVIVLLVAAAGPSFCAQPDATAQIQKGAWCLEFWLNRYQTLLSACVALGAAIVAGLAVMRQIRIARYQVDVMLGNFDPTFTLISPPGGRSHGFILRIQNNSRHAIDLRGLRIVQPTGLKILITGRPSNLIFRAPQQGHEALSYIVQGTWPSAANTYAVEIHGTFKVTTKAAEALYGKRIPMTMQIDYEILAERTRECSIMVEMKEAGISATFIPQVSAEM